MEFLLVIGVFEAFFLAALIFSQKDKSLSDYMLGGFFLIYGINFVLSYLEYYNRSHGFPLPSFIALAPPMILLHGPALWFYVKTLTTQNFQFKTWYLLHFVPFLLMVAAMWNNVYSLPVNERIDLMTSGAIKEQLTYKIFVVAIAVSTIGYFSWGLRLIQGYRKKLKTYFSEIEGYDLSWLRILLTAALVVYIAVNSVYIADLFLPVAPFGVMQFFSFLLGAVYIIFLGFYGLKQGSVFAQQKINLNLEKAVQPGHPVHKTGTKEERFIHQLLKHMQVHKPYLSPEITVARLSKELDVTPEYLSKAINSHLNQNFFDFINRHRINEFKERCRDDYNKQLTLIGIAYECGFNSKATFNRVFKNLAGETPGEYARRCTDEL